MAKTNYEVLEENRESVLQYANGVVETPIPTPEQIKVKTSLAQEAVERGDLTAAIKMLDEIKDNKIGIVWHESGELTNGTSALVRDARGVTTNLDTLKQEAGEKYAMQVLNQVRGGLELLEQSDMTPGLKAQAKEKLEHVARMAMSDIDQLDSKSVKKLNAQMVHVLEEAGIEEAPEKLNFAKETANFKDDHRHIVTLTSVEGRDGTMHTVTEAEIMLNGLTDKQKAQYTAIGNSERGQETGVEWFDNMPPYKQELLRV